MRGDVFQFTTLPHAMEGCDAVIVATGTRNPLDPFGPFNVDYQVRWRGERGVFRVFEWG